MQLRVVAVMLAWAAVGGALAASIGCNVLLSLGEFEQGHAGGGGATGAGAGGSGGSDGGDGGGGDAAGGTAGGSMTPLGPFGPPQKVVELSSAAADDDVSFTGDMLELYFNTTRNSGVREVWKSSRLDTDAPWGTPEVVPELSALGEPDHPVVSADGLALWLALGPPFNIHVSTRSSRAASWSTPVVVAELNSPENDWPDWIAADGQLLIISSMRNDDGANGYDLFTSRLQAVNNTWSPPVEIPQLNTTEADADAWLAPDGLTIYFGSRRFGVNNSDLFVATRSDEVEDWGAPAPVVELNADNDESDPWLSSDMLYIMFVRTETDAEGRDIYEAFRTAGE